MIITSGRVADYNMGNRHNEYVLRQGKRGAAAFFTCRKMTDGYTFKRISAEKAVGLIDKK